MSKDRLQQILVDTIIVNRKKKIPTLGGSERLYNIGYTENSVSPRGSKTYRYE